jgi:hypothetical protein
MGRKVFQPELTELADELGRRAVDIFRRYLGLMRPDTGVAAVLPSGDLFAWKMQQVTHRDQHPLSLKFNSQPLEIISTPQREQDVIAMYHEMVGMGVVRGLKFLATSQHDRYDCLFITDYDDSNFEYSSRTNPFGVSSRLTQTGPSEPYVLEYKYDLDGLIAEIERDVKFASQINLCVCWQDSGAYKGKYFMQPLLIDGEGANRLYFGSTHSVFQQSHRLFEVVILSDLVNFILNATEETARQKIRYPG